MIVTLRAHYDAHKQVTARVKPGAIFPGQPPMLGLSARQYRAASQRAGLIKGDYFASATDKRGNIYLVTELPQ